MKLTYEEKLTIYNLRKQGVSLFDRLLVSQQEMRNKRQFARFYLF